MRLGTRSNLVEGLVFKIEFGDCDETLHPHCEGVICASVVRVSGGWLGSAGDAEELAQALLYDRWTVQEILEGLGLGLLSVSLLDRSRDAAGVVVRDYNVFRAGSRGQGRVYVAGGHDEVSLVEGDEPWGASGTPEVLT